MDPYEYIRKVQKEGGCLFPALKKVGWSYTRWRNACERRGEPRGEWPHKNHRTYTVEKVREVQRRLNQGEFLKDIAPTMGMDSRNLARFCRQNGLQLFTDKQLQRNYAARTHHRGGGRKKGSTRAEMEQLRDRIRAGVPDDVLANEFGRHPESIAAQRRNMGLFQKKNAGVAPVGGKEARAAKVGRAIFRLGERHNRPRSPLAAARRARKTKESDP